MSKLLLTALSLFLAGQLAAQGPADLESRRVHLPNGWALTPAGSSLPLGDLPLNMAVSASKKYLAVTNNGQSVQSLQLIDARAGKILDSVVIAKSWYGLQFSADEKSLYASGGNDNWILQYAVRNNKLVLLDSIILGKKWPNVLSPAGLAINDAKKLLYVVTKENNSLYVVDLSTKQVLQQLPLGAEAYACQLSPGKQTLYISLWGGDKILFYDTKKRQLTDSIAVGDNPNEICQTANGKYLYVANSNDNSVSVIDVQNKKVMETLNAALYPDAPSGSTSNGVALSTDEKQLYVANADNNCLAVFDVSKPGAGRSMGFIPVGWYPTNVKVIGNKIWVTNGKGFSSMANPYGPNPIQRNQEVNIHEGDRATPPAVQYIAGLFKGTMSIINVPAEKDLAAYSQLVYRNTPYTKEKELAVEGGQAGNPVPLKVGDPSPIKHVFYIIKENRTYDQVLGDMPEGNGDSSLVLFGRNITPNQHALAKQFVLLDNFYVDGEVSADGHNWSMGAYANDFLEKAWPTTYGQRGGKNGGSGTLDVALNKAGFIWDLCKRSGVSYRNYGEFALNGKPRLAALKDHTCPYYAGWDIKVRDTSRFYQWRREFDSLLALNAVPQLNTLLMPCDHTEGARLAAPTPFAHVADNDLGVGLFMEHLSKSSIWNESVVFILEDDAQNGPDHVDAHRSPAYIAGGLIKRRYTDHTMYSTSSMLRTIELILGMPPMTQYDAAATPMYNAFMSVPDSSSFTALPALVNLDDKNVKRNSLSLRSAKFDFSKEDAVPDLEFTDVIWKAVRGEHAVTPAPKRSAFVRIVKKDAGDD